MGDAYDVVAEWTELRTWLDHNAPRSAAAVRPGASANELAAAQGRLGVTFTDELAAWFALQGGCGRSFEAELLPGQLPLGLEEALASHAMKTQVADAAPWLAEEREDWVLWSRSFVPIGDDTGGGHDVVDLREVPSRGCVRYHDFENGGPVPVRWASLGHLVADVRRALVDGAVIGGHWQARAHDGVVEWRVIHGATTPDSPWT